MSKITKKSAPFYFKSAPPVTDKTSNVIRGIVIIQEFQGKDTDAYGDNFGVDFLEQLIEQGNAQKQGVRSRFGHPSASGPTALGSYLGRYKDFRLDENSDGKKVVLADLHISEMANKSPNYGTIGDYVMGMAEKESDMCGNSICFIPGEPRLEKEVDENGNEILRPYVQLDSFIASDIVDSPAATDSMFKDTNGTNSGFQITQFLDEHPLVVESIMDVLTHEKASPIDFLLKYFNSKKDNSMAKEKAAQTVAQLKAAKLKEAQDKKNAENASQKSYDATTSGGVTVTISDENGDGKPAVGDKITTTENGEPVSGETAFPDGSSVTSGDDGVITAVTEPTMANDAETANKEIVRLKGVEVAHLKTISQLEAQVADYKSKLEVSDSALDSALADNIKLKEDLAKTKGSHVPPAGDEKFEKEEKPEKDFNDKKAQRKKELEEKKNKIQNKQHRP